MTSHFPNKEKQMVRYYVHYSNVSPDRPKKASTNELIPTILEPVLTSKAYRQNWACPIQKIYELDSLFCPNCQGLMHIISFIEDSQIIKKILKHLGLWAVKRRVLPRVDFPPPGEFPDYNDLPSPCTDEYMIDLVYPFENYL